MRLRIPYLEIRNERPLVFVALLHLKCDLEDQASGAESPSYPHPSPHYRRPTTEGSAISSLTMEY